MHRTLGSGPVSDSGPGMSQGICISNTSKLLRQLLLLVWAQALRTTP